MSITREERRRTELLARANSLGAGQAASAVAAGRLTEEEALAGRDEAFAVRFASALADHADKRREKAEESARAAAAEAALAAALEECDAAIRGAGGVAEKISAADSRYYRMPSGLRVRVSDHAPNAATDDWMERECVASIRVDGRSWRAALAEILTDESANS